MKNLKRVIHYGILCICFFWIYTEISSNVVISAQTSNQTNYATTLFDDSKVHNIDFRITEHNLNKFYETANLEEFIPCDITIDGELYRNVGLRAKGNSTLLITSLSTNSKYSLKIQFDYYVPGQSYHGLNELCLNSGISDATYMKDYLTYKMMSDFGAAAPLSSFAFCTLNNEDFGLYLACESIGSSFLQRNFPGHTTGNLYKPEPSIISIDQGGEASELLNQEEQTLSDCLSQIGFTKEDIISCLEEIEETNSTKPLEKRINTFWASLRQREIDDFIPTLPETPDVTLQYIDDNVDSYKAFWLYGERVPTQMEKKQYIEIVKQLDSGKDLEKCVNMDQLMRYFVVHNYVANRDSYTGKFIHNFFVYVADGKLYMLPWDYNTAFGTFSNTDAEFYINDSIDSPLDCKDLKSRPLLGQIILNEQYKALYHDYYQDFISSIGSEETVSAVIRDTAKLIAPYVKRDGNGYYSYEEFEKAVETLEDFCSLRTESIQNQLTLLRESNDNSDVLNTLAPVDCSSIQIKDMGALTDMFKNIDGANMNLESYVGNANLSKLLKDSGIIETLKKVDFDHTTMSELSTIINAKSMVKKVSFVDILKLPVVFNKLFPYLILFLCVILFIIALYKVSHYQRRN